MTISTAEKGVLKATYEEVIEYFGTKNVLWFDDSDGSWWLNGDVGEVVHRKGSVPETVPEYKIGG